MSDTFILTTSKPLRTGLNEADFRKWEIISVGGSGRGIIIRVQNTGIGFHSQVEYTVHPYKKFSKKWKQRLWFKWLKIKVWIGDLYKS